MVKPDSQRLLMFRPFHRVAPIGLFGLLRFRCNLCQERGVSLAQLRATGAEAGLARGSCPQHAAGARPAHWGGAEFDSGRFVGGGGGEEQGRPDLCLVLGWNTALLFLLVLRGLRKGSLRTPC